MVNEMKSYIGKKEQKEMEGMDGKYLLSSKSLPTGLSWMISPYCNNVSGEGQ